MQELFEKIQDIQDEKVTEITLSYLEIYNETIRDLLVEGGSKQPLMLREDANQAVSVAGLSSHWTYTTWVNLRSVESVVRRPVALELVVVRRTCELMLSMPLVPHGAHTTEVLSASSCLR